MSDPNKVVLLDFPTELYVGTKHLAAFNQADPPLGFATPFGKDKAFEKRKSTVDHWCGDGTVYEYDPATKVRSQKVVGTTKPQVLSNAPQSGFTFDRAVERYVTSNKVFRITDPRGFQLEISADNLSDILLNCEIKKGELVGDFIWGRSGGTNFLTRLDHPAYIRHTMPTITRKNLVPGDHVYLGAKTEEMVYCGEFYVYKASQETLESGYDHIRRDRGYDLKYKIYWGVLVERDPKPFKVFRFLKDDVYRPWVLARSSKTTILSEGNPIPHLPMDGELDSQFDYHFDYHSVTSLFKTKDEAAAFSVPLPELRNMFEAMFREDSQHTYIFMEPGVVPRFERMDRR